MKQAGYWGIFSRQVRDATTLAQPGDVEGRIRDKTVESVRSTPSLGVAETELML